MKINKQLALLITLVFISLGAYLLIPNFEREEFNTDIVEEISTGTISTTTTIIEGSENLPEENLEDPNVLKLVEELKKVYAVMKKNGLERGKNGLKVFLMAEAGQSL